MIYDAEDDTPIIRYLYSKSTVEISIGDFNRHTCPIYEMNVNHVSTKTVSNFVLNSNLQSKQEE